MELWELVARESIRDLVARYNANGDSGRFDQMLAVFADDAVMELVSETGTLRRYEGIDRIASIFTDTKAAWDATVGTLSGAATLSGSAEAVDRPRHHVRHFAATHQIDVDDNSHARGRSYFVVVMAHGVDHWGRYVDEYGVRDGRWLITSRRALSDGHRSGGPTA
jgi:3-phenylpropionate/cinnamic acid dioxygenase small subunit